MLSLFLSVCLLIWLTSNQFLSFCLKHFFPPIIEKIYTKTIKSTIESVKCALQVVVLAFLIVEYFTGCVVPWYGWRVNWIFVFICKPCFVKAFLFVWRVAENGNNHMVLLILNLYERGSFVCLSAVYRYNKQINSRNTYTCTHPQRQSRCIEWSSVNVKNSTHPHKQ